MDMLELGFHVIKLVKVSPCSNGACQSDEGGIDGSMKEGSEVTKVAKVT